MARTLDQWVTEVQATLAHVPAEMRRARAEELTRSVRAIQKTAPRGKWRRIPGRGYAALFRSILVDAGAKTPNVYTDHPAATALEDGGIVRPLRGSWLLVRLRGGGSTPLRGMVALRTGSGSLVLVRKKRMQSGVVAILLRSVRIDPTRWVTRGVDAQQRGSEKRIADRVLGAEGRNGV